MESFEIRGFNPCESLLRHTPEQLRAFIRRMKALNMNTLIIHYDYGWKRYRDIIIEECENAGIEIILMTFGPRTFFSYSDWDKKWFAKDENGEPFNHVLECETYPCTFADGVLEAYEYGVKEWLRSLPPQIHHVHMRAADGHNSCRCEKCRKLPVYEKWQPFVDAFVKAVLETRPDLKFETDIYMHRYSIPEHAAAFSKMTGMMFDTFYRHTAFPLGSNADSFNSYLTEYASTVGEKYISTTPNEYYLEKLKEWNTRFPNKVYIHENAMKQSLYGTFQYATSTYLQDLEIYRKLGLRGVCYEAFEPGYSNFAQMFEILARAMNGEEIEYEETEIEKAIAKTDMKIFCTDYDFPLEKYISDSFQLKNAQLYREFRLNLTPELYREYVRFAFDNSDKLDPVYIGFSLADYGRKYNTLKFDNLSDRAYKMHNTVKLWDFMENIPLCEDPIKICTDLIWEMVEKVK